MRNLALALGVGVLLALALYLPGWLKLGEAIVPGVIAIVVAYFVLARRTLKKVEAIFVEAGNALQAMPPRFDQGIAVMQRAYAYAPQQFGIKSQVDTQIGVVYFLQQEYNKALPYLERSYRFGHWMGGAMLAVIHYKKKNHDEMRRTLDYVCKRARKQGLVWNLYAYLLMQIGDKDRAQQVLIDGLKHTKDDPRVKDSLLAIQNGKKIKMKAYKEQWYQFHLERPPAQYQMAPIGGRVSKSALRGRW